MEIVLIALAGYGISWAVAESSGPFNILALIRGSNEWCASCAAFWITAVLAGFYAPQVGILGWLGAWGIVVAVHKLINAYIVRGV